MSKLIVLGSANAVPDEHHENTHLVLAGEQSRILIDCAENPLVRLHQVNVELPNLTDIILTHFHPDHVSGIPSLLMSSWLLGRREQLNIYGLDHTLDRLDIMMSLYEWEKWPDFFPVAFHRLPTENMTLVLENDDFRIFSSPVYHILPTIGLRIESPQTSKVMAYSCDTEPCPQVVELAKEADILIHEATGGSFGHSTAAQAGEMARKAQVKALYLIHYTAKDFPSPSLMAEAQKEFPGEVKFAEDFMELSF